jgi:hypothetical protein
LRRVLKDKKIERRNGIRNKIKIHFPLEWLLFALIPNIPSLFLHGSTILERTLAALHTGVFLIYLDTR